MLKPIIIIPARYGSTRFPGKPLEKVGDKTLIEQTIETGKRSGYPVYVATDDKRIAKVCEDIGQEYVMTDKEHKNGTERCSDAMVKLIDKYGAEFTKEFDFVINLQGDSPLIPEYVFHLLVAEYEERLFNSRPFDVITPTFKLNGMVAERFMGDRRRGKAGGTTVVTTSDNRALYFSKEMIPYGADISRVESAASKIDMYYHCLLYTSPSPRD